MIRVGGGLGRGGRGLDLDLDLDLERGGRRGLSLGGARGKVREMCRGMGRGWSEGHFLGLISLCISMFLCQIGTTLFGRIGYENQSTKNQCMLANSKVLYREPDPD